VNASGLSARSDVGDRYGTALNIQLHTPVEGEACIPDIPLVHMRRLDSPKRHRLWLLRHNTRVCFVSVAAVDAAGLFALDPAL
jgi:hypothetical protein